MYGRFFFQECHKSISSMNQKLDQIFFLDFLPFLDASTHLYKRVCPSVGPLVHQWVGPSVHQSVGPSVSHFFKSRKSSNLTNLTDLTSLTNLQIWQIWQISLQFYLSPLLQSSDASLLKQTCFYHELCTRVPARSTPVFYFYVDRI